EQNTVLAITSQSENMQAVLDAAWELLLPALDVPAERQDPAADEKLADRLAALRLAPVEAAESPSAGAERWTEAAFTVAAGPDAEVNPGASVPLAESVPVAAVGLAAGESGWQLTLSTEDDAVTVPVGLGEWAVAAGTPPVAGSGGWVDEDTFRADVIMLETPHRFQVTCSLRDRTATAAWRTVPLHKSALSEMCAPRRPTGLLRP
ncbi:MAG TPA: hypothetical protein VK020_00820, partial [Microlunatus sp.]|nr:hypothetical protein [Microlunatus sp.]